MLSFHQADVEKVPHSWPTVSTNPRVFQFWQYRDYFIHFCGVKYITHHHCVSTSLRREDLLHFPDPELLHELLRWKFRGVFSWILNVLIVGQSLHQVIKIWKYKLHPRRLWHRYNSNFNKWLRLHVGWKKLFRKLQFHPVWFKYMVVFHNETSLKPRDLCH